MHGIEYYGKVLQKYSWSFSYIQSFEGHEVFFYPFEISGIVKDAIIYGVTKSGKKQNATISRRNKKSAT